MDYSKKIARVLLGLILIIYGLNGLLGFFPPMPERAQQMLDNMGFWLHNVHLIEIIVGVALLINRFVPLALLVLAPISLNILAFHLVFYPTGILPGALVAALNGYLIYLHFDFYRPLFRKRPA
jgi:putative oxidoreductase